jgi:hypothetical protein
MIQDTMELGPLPELRLRGVQASVDHETEIGDAVAALLARLHGSGAGGTDVVVTYDGTDDRSIVVTAGVLDGTGVGLTEVLVPASDRGVSARFDAPPVSTGDVWIALDAQLGTQGLGTCGIHRQTITSAGPVVLQAPIASLEWCAL